MVKDPKELGITQPITWLSDEDYKKAVGQLRLQLVGVFTPFECYGLQAFIPGATIIVIKLAEDFGLRVRGVDHPIDYKIAAGHDIEKPAV